MTKLILVGTMNWKNVYTFLFIGNVAMDCPDGKTQNKLNQIINSAPHKGLRPAEDPEMWALYLEQIADDDDTLGHTVKMLHYEPYMDSEVVRKF